MIFLIGANGFFGSAFSTYLKKKNINHKKITKKNYKKFINKKCDLLINCSTNSKKYIAEKFPAKDFVLTPINVLNSIRDFKFKKYLLISTGDVYGLHNIKKSNESLKIEDLNFVKSYSFNKILAEKILINSKKPHFIFRMGGLIGNNLKKNLIFDLINHLPLRFTLNSRFQFINTEKAVDIIFKIINKKNTKNKIFNLSGKGQISVKQIIDILRKNHAIKKVIYFSEMKYVDYKISTKRIERFIKLPGTVDTIKKFLKNYKK